MKAKMFNVSRHARRFGKHDLERLGLFTEMPYLPVRVKPSKKSKEVKEPEILGGLSVLAGAPKTKCGNMDGYFDEEFKRVFQGERSKKKKVKEVSKNVSPLAFIPTGPTKQHATPGDFCGTFGPVLSEFSPVKRKKAKYVHELPNPTTSPGKKGGPGYIDITLGPYPEYIGGRPRAPKKTGKLKLAPLVTVHFPKPYFGPNPYKDAKEPTTRVYNPPKEPKMDKKLKKLLLGRQVFIPTGPGKWDGGCKAGGFSKMPGWVKEKWLNPLEKEQALAGTVMPFIAGEFYPHSYGSKTMYNTSTLCKTDYSMNATNWKDYEPKWVKRLVKSIY